MAKIYKHYKSNYTQMQNNIIDDKSLSFKALGLWVYMWRQIDDWHFTVDGIADARNVGVTQIRSALKELEQKGYLRREYTYTQSKKDVIYHLSDVRIYKK